MKNLKKILLMLIVMVMFVFLLTITSKAVTKVKVTGDTLNIRKGPSTSEKVIAMLFKGVECELLEEEGNWYKIKYRTYTGYVSKDYVEIIEESTDKNNNKSDDTNSIMNEQNSNTTINNDKSNVDNNVNNITNKDNDEKNDTSNKEKIEIIYKKAKQNINLKILPLIYSSNVENVNKNEEVILIAENGDWSYIQTDNNCGWTRTEYLDNTEKTKANNDNVKNNDYAEKTAYINENLVNMRKGAGTSYSIIKVLSLNTQLTIIGEENSWYKVKVANSIGYVSKNYVSDTKTTTTRGNNTARTNNVLLATSSSKKTTENIEETKNTVTVENKIEKQKENITNKIKGTDIVAYAKKYLGYKYVYGGDGSNGTFDCSGFTMYIYKHFGINIPHGANSQYKCGKGKQIIEYSDLQIGDIVMLTDYETGVGIGHCGIYIGNDNFIHASTTCNAVEISSFKTIYKGRFYAGLRLL